MGPTEKEREIEKSKEREIMHQLVGIILIMLAYWLLLIEMLRLTGRIYSTLFMLILFFAPLPLVYWFMTRAVRPRPFRKGMRHFEKRRYVLAEHEFGEARRDMHMGAAKMLGDMYMHGIGVERDPDRAVEEYRQALSSFYFVHDLLPAYVEGGRFKRRAARSVTRDQSREQVTIWMGEIIRTLEQAAPDNLKAARLLESIHGMENYPWSDRDKSIRYARLAAEKEDSLDSRANLGLRLINASDVTEAEIREGVAILEGCFEEGSLFAGWSLAMHFANGDNPHLPRDWRRVGGYLSAILDHAVGNNGENPEKVLLYVESIGSLLAENGQEKRLSAEDCRKLVSVLRQSEFSDPKALRLWEELATKGQE